MNLYKVKYNSFGDAYVLADGYADVVKKMEKIYKKLEIYSIKFITSENEGEPDLYKDFIK